MKTKRNRPQRKVFPSYEKLIETTAFAVKYVSAPTAIVGGLAMQVWGSDRLTNDVDLIAPVAPHGLRGVHDERPLTFGGVATTINGIAVDFIVRDDEFEPLYDEALAYSEEYDDLPTLVVGPEYLVAMKMVAGRPKDEHDLHFLLTDPDVELDLKRAEVIVKEHLGRQSVRELRDLRATALWLKSQGKI
jgi:hypothetical protein